LFTHGLYFRDDAYLIYTINGEYDPHKELIVVSYKAFKRSGTLQLL